MMDDTLREQELQAEIERLKSALAGLLFGPELSKLSRNVHEITLAIGRLERHMTKALDTLTTEVSEAATVQASAITLLQGLSTQLKDALGDEKALQALSDQLDAQTQALATAVAANTPAAPDAPPADTPPTDTPTA